MSRLDVRDFGAVGDGVTDDRVAIQAAMNVAVAAGQSVYFPNGRYKTKGYVNVTGARNIWIVGDGATIVYASDAIDVGPDEIATSRSQARSGLFLRYCTDIILDGLRFEGGDATEIITVNCGSGVYLRHCTGVTLWQCSKRAGHSLIQGDAAADTSHTGHSLLPGPEVTLTDLHKLFNPGHVGHKVTLAGCTHIANNGSFVITSVISATQVTFTNAAGVEEISPFKWSIDDGDKGTRIEGGRSDGVHGSCTTGNHSIFRDHHFEWPTNADVCGIGDALTFDGTTVTLTDTAGQGGGRFLPRHHGNFIVIKGATTTLNDGTWQISYISATQVSWTNASGKAELFHGSWWILGGDKTGRGSFLSQGGTLTITSATPAFSADDVGKMIRVLGATSPGNNTGAIIASVTSATAVVAYHPSDMPEAFSGVWTINAYDNGQDASGNTHGSSHAIYVFGGRQNIVVDSCMFIGNRTCCVKISGTNGSLRNVTVRNCFAQECASFVIAGADDVNEHTQIAVDNNRLIDCSIQRVGWDAGGGISFLGTRNVSATNNQFHWTRNSISSVSGHGQGSVSGISANRYVDGHSQPVEDLWVNGNKFTSDPSSTKSASIIHTAIMVSDVGLRAKYANAGSLTFSSPTVTLTDVNALFTQAEVGRSIWLMKPTGEVEGPFEITGVPSKTTLTYTNANGAVGQAGTYRIKGPATGGACIIANNQILSVGAIGISCVNNVGPEVNGNIFSGLTSNIRFNGDVSPRAVNNRVIGVDPPSTGITLSPGTSWPFIDDNIITNGAIGASPGNDMGVSVLGPARVDYPLLGKRGRALPAYGREEVVIAYGSQLVDGDTIEVTAGETVKYTFKATSPSKVEKQFNSFNTDSITQPIQVGLVGLIGAQAGVDCADYGTGFGGVVTYHLRIRRKNATSGTDGTLQVSVIALNPTALVSPYNYGVGDPRCCLGRGSATANGFQWDRTVIWSLDCTWSGGVMIWADNQAAQKLLQASGWRPLKDPNNAGACEIVTHGPTSGSDGAPGPEFRWVIA
jgi:hypothetical protein